MRLATRSRRWTGFAGALGALLSPCLVASQGYGTASRQARGALTPARLQRFESSLEVLRRQMEIPGLSAAIVSQGQVAWARGLGLADVERGIEATCHTPYPLASVTKPFAAVVVMQLAEEGVLSLEAPVSRYGLAYESPGVIRVRHLLSHTSRGQPGHEFSYDSDRFADLGWVIARASDRSFRELLMERILLPLGMRDTAPVPLSMGDGVLSPFQIWLDPRNARVYRRQARPYALDRSFTIVNGHDSILFSPAGGLVSSVADLARFDIALDANRLLPETAKTRMFSPVVTPGGRELPYGMGWFTQRHGGTRLVWHYGWNPPTASALYLKLPDEDLTFLALANTDALSRPFDLGRGDVLDSAVAMLFYETFVLAPRGGRGPSGIDWEADEDDLVAALQDISRDGLAEVGERELRAYRRLFHAMGRLDRVEALDAVYRRLRDPSASPGEQGLPALGEHLLPWPTFPLFGMVHLTAMTWFLLVCLSTAVSWPWRAMGRRLGRLSRPEAAKGIGKRVTPVLATLTVLTGGVLYVALLSRWPGEAPPTWSAGSPLVRGFIATAAMGGALSAVAAIQILATARTGPVLARVSRLLAASGICAGAGALLDLAGWI